MAGGSPCCDVVPGSGGPTLDRTRKRLIGPGGTRGLQGRSGPGDEVARVRFKARRGPRHGLVGTGIAPMLGHGGGGSEMPGIGGETRALPGIGLIGAGVARDLVDGTRPRGAMPGIGRDAFGLCRQWLIAAFGTGHT